MSRLYWVVLVIDPSATRVEDLCVIGGNSADRDSEKKYKYEGTCRMARSLAVTAASPQQAVASSEEAIPVVALVELPWEVGQRTTLLDRYLVLHLGPRSVMTSSSSTTA